MSGKQLVVLGLGWQEARNVIVFRSEPTSNCHSEERSDEESRIGSFFRFREPCSTLRSE